MTVVETEYGRVHFAVVEGMAVFGGAADVIAPAKKDEMVVHEVITVEQAVGFLAGRTTAEVLPSNPDN